VKAGARCAAAATEDPMPDPAPGTERPYQIDDEWSRRVFAGRTGKAAAFLLPHLRAGMRLIDCGCGPGSITVDLAQVVDWGEAIGIDLRQDAVAHGRNLASRRELTNVRFVAASIYALPVADASFDAAFACAVLQHLAAPIVALREMRRVLKPGGVIGIVDGSSTLTFRYPTNPFLDKWDKLRALERQHRTGRPAEMLPLRTLLGEAGFQRTQALGTLTTEVGPPAGTIEETRKLAQNHVVRLRGVLGELAIAQGWATEAELEAIAGALLAWGDAPDAFYARPSFSAIGWA
jgi:ubiquinone/menaquinone biosynthesis C-methylase UbiE